MIRGISSGNNFLINKDVSNLVIINATTKDKKQTIKGIGKSNGLK